MKKINILLLLVLISAINSGLTSFGGTKECINYAPKDVISLGGDEPAFSLDFCRTTEYSGYYRCCFLKYEDANKRRQYHCLPISNTDFYDIERRIDEIEASLKVEIDYLDCGSSYLYASLLLIFALLL